MTWDPILHRSPNRPDRRWATDRLLAFLLLVLRDYRLANPGAPPVLVGDLSLPVRRPVRQRLRRPRPRLAPERARRRRLYPRAGSRAAAAGDASPTSTARSRRTSSAASSPPARSSRSSGCTSASAARRTSCRRSRTTTTTCTCGSPTGAADAARRRRKRNGPPGRTGRFGEERHCYVVVGPAGGERRLREALGRGLGLTAHGQCPG